MSSRFRCAAAVGIGFLVGNESIDTEEGGRGG